MPTPASLDWKPIFLEALRNMPVISHACDAAGIARSTAWRQYQDDEEFKAAWDDAMETAIDKAEQEAYRRAVDGWNEPVIDKGRLAWAYERKVSEEGIESFSPVLDANGQPVPLTIRKRSDSLLQFVLKGRRRNVYGDKQEITGANGGPVTVLDETKKAARIAALMELAKVRKDIG